MSSGIGSARTPSAATVRRRGQQRRRSPPHEHQVRAAPGQRQGDAAADARAPAGDQGDFCCWIESCPLQLAPLEYEL
jgi:hypothetical protein